MTTKAVLLAMLYLAAPCAPQDLAKVDSDLHNWKLQESVDPMTDDRTTYLNATSSDAYEGEGGEQHQAGISIPCAGKRVGDVAILTVIDVIGVAPTFEGLSSARVRFGSDVPKSFYWQEKGPHAIWLLGLRSQMLGKVTTRVEFPIYPYGNRFATFDTSWLSAAMEHAHCKF